MTRDAVLRFVMSCFIAIVPLGFGLRADDQANEMASQSVARLDRLIEEPSTMRLKDLLPGQLGAEPIRLLQRESPVTQKLAGPVWKFQVEEQKFYVVLAELAARDPDTGRVMDDAKGPEAGFLFTARGDLLSQFGGKYSPKGSPERVDIVNLGPEEDWFVRVSSFIDRPPFDFRMDWYRIAMEPVRSLRVFAYPNGNPWTFGPKPVIRYGTLIFNNRGGRQTPISVPGMTADQRPMPRSIYWDGDRNRFAGAARELCEGKPLFEIDTDWSKDFDALSLKPDQMLILGGVREYDHWHAWEVLIPERTEARLTLKLPEVAESQATAKTIALKAGMHFIQLQLKPSAGNAGLSLELRVDEEKPDQFRLPAGLSDHQPPPPELVRVVDRGTKPHLTQAAIEGTERPVTLTIWRP